MESFKLKVLTPVCCFYEDDVTMAEFTTTSGNVGIYKGHIPMTFVVAPGALTMHKEGEIKKAALLSGFVQVLGDRVTILAEACEWPEDIDEDRCKEAMERAKRRIESKEENIDLARAELALKKALVRLGVKDGTY
mgnify:FL=1|jgi:ATP synthase F1, epsilon subunit